MAWDDRPKAHCEGRGASKAWPESPRPHPEARPGREPAWPLGYRVPPEPVPQKHALGAHTPEARPRTHPGRELAWPLGYRVPPEPPPRARSTGPPRQGGQSTWRSGGQEQPVRSPGRQAGHGLTPGGHPPVPALVPGGRSVPHPQEGLTRARRNRRRGRAAPPRPQEGLGRPGGTLRRPGCPGWASRWPCSLPHGCGSAGPWWATSGRARRRTRARGPGSGRPRG